MGGRPDGGAGAFDADGWEVLAQVPFSVSIVDLSGRMVFVNAAFRHLFGIDESRLDGLRIDDITRSVDLDWTHRYLDRLRSGEAAEVVVDKRYVRPDGSEFVGRLAAHPVRGADGRVVAMSAVIVDVSEQIAAVAARHATEAKYNELIEAQRELICEWTPDGTVVSTNAAYRAFFGFGPEVVGRNVFDLVPATEVSRQQAMVQAFHAGQERHELRRSYADRRVVAWSNTVIRDDQGRLVSVLSVGRDETERSRLEHDLQIARDEALRTADERRRFVDIAGHELRNPLHAMLGVTELLARRSLDDDSTQLVEALYRQTAGLRRIVDDLVDYNRLGAGAVAVAPRDRPCDVRALLHDIARLLTVGDGAAHRPGADASPAGSSGGAGHSGQPGHPLVRVSVDADVPPVVRTDPDRLAQILRNLCQNALTHAPGAPIDVVARLAAPGLLHVQVTDDGPGIPDDALDDVFEPFRQVPGTRGGSGLGLAIVRLLLDQVGGRVGVRNVPGRGAGFWFDLPVGGHDGPLDAATEGETAAGALPTGVRILVVEDDPINQFLAERQFAALGTDVTIVGDGATALERCCTQHFDLVLMDYLLPGIDGLETTRRLRELEPGLGRRHVVVAVTASEAVAHRAACAAAGMDDFVPKPVGLEDLRRVIRRWFGPFARPGAAPASPTPRSAPVAVATRESVDMAAPAAAPAPGGHRLDDLAAELGGRGPVERIATRFLDELDRRAAAVTSAVGEADAVAARREAHTLASLCRLVGADELAARCAAIEQAARAAATAGPAGSHLPDGGALLAGFVAAVETARTAVRSWLDR